jgi:hypothetical protein
MRTLFLPAKALLLPILSLFMLSISAQSPIIFRLSEAVKPGELVTVYGEGLTQTGIEVAVDATTVSQPTANSTKLEVVSSDPEGHYVTAILKENLQAGVFNLWVKNATGWSNALQLNTARPQWLSIDLVAEGLKVKVVGKNLDGKEFGAARNTLVKLKNGASEFNATVLDVNPYAVDFTVSASVPKATYDVLVSNNGGSVWKELESDQRLTVVEKSDDPLELGVAWAKDFNWTRQYNVKDYGAKGDGIANETTAIQSAIDAVKSAGGGVVFFPIGTYKSTSIQLPAGVVLQGESRENSVLSFSNNNPTNFITTKGDGITNGRTGVANLKIGIEMKNPYQVFPDHFVNFGNANGSGLTWVVFTVNRTAEKFFIKDVIFDYPTTEREGRGRTIGIYANQYVLMNGIEAKGWNVNTSGMTSKYSEISDCNFEAYNEGGFTLSANMYTLMERNSIRFKTPINDKSIDRGYEITSHSYIANNHVENSSSVDNWNEQILFEPRDGITKMYGTITAGTSTSVTVNPRKDANGVLYGHVTDSYLNLPAIAQQNNWSLEYNKYPQGWYITITDGRGLGQFRKVISLNSTTSLVGIDKPWDVIPNNTSKFVITVPALNNIAYKNTMKTGSKPLLFYQNSYETVFADNYSEDTQGYHITNYYVLSGGTSKSRFASSYFNRMVNNVAIGVARNRSTGGIGYHYDMQLVEATGENAFAYTCYGMDIKNNSVRSVLPAPDPATRETPPINGIYLGSYIRAGQGSKNAIKGATIENNLIRNSNRGISIGGTLYPFWNSDPKPNTTPMSFGIVVKGNRFMNVTNKIVDNTTAAQKSVFIDNGDINDQTPPVTASTFNNNTLTLTATDDISGVMSTQYSVDNGLTWKIYSDPVILTTVGSSIKYRSVDRALNIEQAKELLTSVGDNPITDISVYPAITSDRIYFRNLPEDSHVMLIDMVGRILLLNRASELIGGMSLQTYTNGLYIVRVMLGHEHLQSVKVIKK